MTVATALYKVRYFGDDGSVLDRTVEARSSTEASTVMGLPNSRVVSIQRDVIGGLFKSFRNRGVSLEVQAAILTSFAAQLLGGSNIGKTFDRVVSNYRQFANRLPELKQKSLTSEKMELLKFDGNLVLLARVGEKSGDLGSVMANAVDDLLARREMLAEASKGRTYGIILSVGGLFVMLALPLMVADMLKEIDKLGKSLAFHKNILTHMLEGLYFIETKMWYLVLAGLAAVFAMRAALWEMVRGVKPFSVLEEQGALQRGLFFISAFRPLHEAGVQDKKAVEEIARSAKGNDRLALQAIVDHINAGGSLGSAFSDRLWPDALKDGMRGYDKADSSGGRLDILRRLGKLIRMRVMKVNQTITVIAGLFGASMALLTMAMVFGGIMMPFLTASPGRG